MLRVRDTDSFLADGSSLLASASDRAFARRIADLKVANSAGEIGFAPASATVYSVGDAVARLHDLHRRALEDSPVVDLVDGQVDPRSARALFRVACTSLMMQCTSTADSHAIDFMESILDAAAQLQDTGGLESILMTAVLALPHEDEVSQRAYLEQWAAIPLDERVGAGHQISLAVEKYSGELLTFKPNLITELKLLSKATSGIRARLTARMDRFALTNQQCVGATALRYGVVGGMAGFIGGGGIGVAAGIPAGVAVGEAIGNVFCPPDAKTPLRDQGVPRGEPGGQDEPEQKEPDDDLICIPRYDDLVLTDPYAKRARRSATGFLPFGNGLLAFSTTLNGIFRLTSVQPLVEMVARDLNKNRVRIDGAIHDRQKPGRTTWSTQQLFATLETGSEAEPPISEIERKRVTKIKNLDYRVEIIHSGPPVGDDEGAEAPVGEIEQIAVEFDPGSKYHGTYGPRIQGAAAEWFLRQRNITKEIILRLLSEIDFPKEARLRSRLRDRLSS